eukprot:scaffold47951_cov31-Tisochrysis_lutea.AAC.7
MARQVARLLKRNCGYSRLHSLSAARRLAGAGSASLRDCEGGSHGIADAVTVTVNLALRRPAEAAAGHLPSTRGVARFGNALRAGLSGPSIGRL